MDTSSLPIGADSKQDNTGFAIAPQMTTQGYPGYRGSMEPAMLAGAIRSRGAAHNMQNAGAASDGMTSSGAGADGSAGNINTM